MVRGREARAVTAQVVAQMTAEKAEKTNQRVSLLTQRGIRKGRIEAQIRYKSTTKQSQPAISPSQTPVIPPNIPSTPQTVVIKTPSLLMNKSTGPLTPFRPPPLPKRPRRRPRCSQCQHTRVEGVHYDQEGNVFMMESKYHNGGGGSEHQKAECHVPNKHHTKKLGKRALKRVDPKHCACVSNKGKQ